MTFLVACSLAGATGCSKKIVVGKQCPSPASGNATVEGDDDELQPAYGTSCAPCDGDIELDDDGCPIYVTFDSCGGDICLGRTLIREVRADAGMGDAAAGDAAAMEDGAMADGAMEGEDGGA